MGLLGSVVVGGSDGILTGLTRSADHSSRTSSSSYVQAYHILPLKAPISTSQSTMGPSYRASSRPPAPCHA